MWLGDTAADSVLVLLSGVHGVETPVGCAIQVDLLLAMARSGWQAPAGQALLLVHQLCPWGFAWDRRCDQAGVDLNRNGVDVTHPLPVNADYRLLRPLLRQEHAELRRQGLAEYRVRLGDRRVDLKEVDGHVLVIEVNDNPSIDAGVEDQVLGEELYRQIVAQLLSTVQTRGRS